MSEDADREREAKVERLEARVRELEAALGETSALLPDATAYAAACGQLADMVKMDNSDLAIPTAFILRCRGAIANAAAARPGDATSIRRDSRQRPQPAHGEDSAAQAARRGERR